MTNEQQANSYIVFQLAGTSYAIPSADVHQMEIVEQITPVPNAPEFVEGVVFSRGQVIPAINLRVRFGFAKCQHDIRTRLIVTSVQDRTIGIIVDAAREFVVIPNDSIQPPHEAINGVSGKCLNGVTTLDGRIVLILNLNQLLDLTETTLPTPAGA
jgi:purine-binding chemotaxis protein CheW